MKAQLIAGAGPLSRVPPLAVFVVVAAVFVVGVLVRGVPGALLLGLLAAGVALMLAATWEALAPGQRGGRLLILAVLIAVAVSVVLVK
jgi:predicted neutral ceramidase superfamily lipid hydrolase